MEKRTWINGVSDTAPQGDQAFAPGTDTPIGAELLAPSMRGREHGPNVTHGQNVPSPIQGKARGVEISRRMHGQNAASIDAKTARAADQKNARLQRRAEKRAARSA